MKILSLSLDYGKRVIITSEKTKFRLMFDNSIDWTKRPNVICVIKEATFEISRKIDTYLKREGTSTVEGYVELTFPESLSGATITLFVFVMLPEIINGGTTQIPYSKEGTFNVLCQNGNNSASEVIKKSFWTKEETSQFDVSFPEVQDVYPDDYAFLHVHTQNLFGKRLWIDSSMNDRNNLIPVPAKTNMCQVLNNTLSVPYNMQDILARFLGIYPDKSKLEADIKIFTKIMQYRTDCPYLTLHKKGTSPNPVRPTSSPPVKVIINDVDLEPVIHTRAKCSVEFRPQKNYEGEYGFSWIRTGDTVPNAGNPFNDHKYKDVMGKHCYTDNAKIFVQKDSNKYSDPFYKDSSTDSQQIFFPAANGRREEIDDSFRKGVMFERMSRRHLQLLYGWNDSATNKPFRTFAPVVTVLLNRNPQPLTSLDVDLDLFFDVKEIPEKILLEFNNKKAENFLTLSKKEFTGIPQNKSNSINNSAHKLKITCTGEFNDEYVLYARAFGKNDLKGNICGALRFHPNSPAYQQNINLAVFNVITNIKNRNPPPTGKLKLEEEEKIHDILGQALTRVNIETIDLDTTMNSIAIDPIQNPNFFKDNFCKNGKIDHNKYEKMHDYLLDKIDIVKYRDYYKLFVFNEAESDSAGYSWSYRYTVLFTQRAIEDGAHELGHALDLPHTFDGFDKNAKFTYQYCKTNNLMDYSSLIGKKTYSLEHWQWQIVNIKIR